MANTKLAQAAPGTVVKLNESGAPVEFLVLQQGYPVTDNGNTLLWRKSIYSNTAWGSNNAYSPSAVNALLNGEYLQLLDADVQAGIVTVSIPYTVGGGNNTVTTLDCKIFILSATEVGFPAQQYMNTEGSPIAYFSDNSKRIAYFNNTAAIWYTRSPSTASAYTIWRVNTDGTAILTGQSTQASGVVPALCLLGESWELTEDGTLVKASAGGDMFIPSTELEQGVEYYFRVYPRNHQNQFQTGIDGSVVTAIPGSAKVMTAVIDLSDSNPATCVSYADDAANMTPGSAEWDEFFGHYPCLFKDGAEVGRLNPNDFTKFEDGSPADITSGAAGDVMIAFPRRGVKITTSGTKVTVSMTDGASEDGFSYLAHQRGETDKDVFYLGAYKGFVDSGKLRSLSGKTPTVKQYINAFRTQAHAQGAGYEQSAFYQLVFRQCMYILKYKNLNSQATIGKGYVWGPSDQTNPVQTGATNTNGMDWGDKSSLTSRMKLFGLEDFWGNVYEFIDGVVSDASRNILTATDNFNDSGSGYTNCGQTASANLSGFMSAPQGASQTGFVGKTAGGSATTYFCDQVIVNPSCIVQYGGNWTAADNGGIFMLYLANASSYFHNSIGSRLMYL